MQIQNWQWGFLTRYYLTTYFFDRRWLLPILFLPILIMGITASLSLSVAGANVKLNAWDVITNVLNNTLFVHHGLNNLFTFIVSRSLFTEDLSLFSILRAKSRRALFWFQWASVLAGAFGYGLLTCSVLLGITLFLMPEQASWGEAAPFLLSLQGLSSEKLLAIPPIPTVIFMLLLLTCTWFVMGLITSSVIITTQNAWLGFATGFFLNYSAFFIRASGLRWDVLDLLWFHRRIFFWEENLNPTLVVNLFEQALVYWFIAIVVSSIGLLVACQKTDITFSFGRKR